VHTSVTRQDEPTARGFTAEHLSASRQAVNAVYVRYVEAVEARESGHDN